ncbi:MAG: M23 family metallopeptidase [Leptospirales bacterium]
MRMKKTWKMVFWLLSSWIAEIGFSASPVFSEPVKPAVSVVQGGFFLVCDPSGKGADTVSFLGRSYPMEAVSRSFFGLPSGSRVALVGIDFSQKPGIEPMTLETPSLTVPIRIVSRSFQISRLTVKSRFVSPPPALIARIIRERRQIIAALARHSPILFDRPFLLPVQGRITHDFGAIRILNGKTMSRHSGEDIDAPEGSPVLAANDGTVVLAGRFYYDGNMVIIDHGGGLLTEYLHMSTILVHSGERVHEGTLVGRVGHTGRVTGPVFHYGAVLSGRHINPMLLSVFPGSRLFLETRAQTALH